VNKDQVAISLEDFRRKYQAAKKNTSLTQTLGRGLLAPVEAEVGRTPGVACKAGCPHCCHIRVVAFPFEIVAIYFRLVNTLSPAELKAFKARLQERFETIRDMSMDERFRTNVQCPLLENGSCSVYDVRPVACAGYHSLSLAECIDSFEHPEDIDHPITMAMSVKKELDLRQAIAHSVLQGERDDATKHELIRSLWTLFQQPSLIQRWKDGRAIFQAPEDAGPGF
jgi:Fe-S-cluster containining protein